MLSKQLATILKAGGVAVVRTDTLYGILARADNEAAVNRVYNLKGRDDNKPPIVLVAEYSQLFDKANDVLQKILKQEWPGPVSVIIPSPSAPTWIKRGGSTVAYRLPDSTELQQLIRETGPLIAPSANPQGKVPACTVDMAKQYFGEAVDWYEDGGEVVNSTPSKLIRVSSGGEIERLR